MLKEICAALLEADVNIMLVKRLRLVNAYNWFAETHENLKSGTYFRSLSLLEHIISNFTRI